MIIGYLNFSFSVSEYSSMATMLIKEHQVNSCLNYRKVVSV